MSGVVVGVDGSPGGRLALRFALEGHPALVLVEVAKDADLLVVGSRGQGGFKALVLGSASAAVMHHAPCPVVIVPAQPAE